MVEQTEPHDGNYTSCRIDEQHVESSTVLRQPWLRKREEGGNTDANTSSTLYMSLQTCQFSDRYWGNPERCAWDLQAPMRAEDGEKVREVSRCPDRLSDQ
jgi:hypothetical protein